MSDIWTTSTEKGEAIAKTLPPLTGRVSVGAPLMRLSWFRTGGPADVLFEPADEADLIKFLQAYPADKPLTVLGVGSNVLVRDGGLRGAVVRLGRAFSQINPDGTHIEVGAGAMDVHVAKAAAKEGLAGLEFLVGVPGTIGGAVAMNAGAYGREIKDILTSARAVDRQGVIHTINPTDYAFSYRKSGLPADWIILSALLQGQTGDSATITTAMHTITTSRSESQPIGSRTGGSTFKNPDPEISGGRSAWQLIDTVGCRGLRIGDAEISQKHCNFLINHGKASAADIEAVGEQARQKVIDETGVALEWEVKIIGDPIDVKDAI